jgi:hypothetical protein
MTTNFTAVFNNGVLMSNINVENVWQLEDDLFQVDTPEINKFDLFNGWIEGDVVHFSNWCN